jgi:hypothetical protein
MVSDEHRRDPRGEQAAVSSWPADTIRRRECRDFLGSV